MIKKNLITRSKILVILGTTASGKTKLAVKLARLFNGEIISADSRQVFKGMDIGTGKDLKEYGTGKNKVAYHLINVVDPNEEFNLAKYQDLANKAIKKIISSGHLPILVGGSGLYLQAVVDGYQLAPYRPELKKRVLLEKKSVSELYKLLESAKPDFAHKLNNSDKNNPRRLIRYLEIVDQEKSSNFSKKEISKQGFFDEVNKNIKKGAPYDFLLLGLDRPSEEIRKLILERLKNRLEKEGMIKEVERLVEEGVDYSKLYSFGLEYRFISFYLQSKMEYEEMVEKLGLAIYHFAKRQKTWFRRWEKQGREIKWISNLKETKILIKQWLLD